MSVQVEGSPQDLQSTVAGTQLQNAGLYLAMRLGQETYAIDILRVREIIEPVSITRIPRAASYVKGVINLRGKVISIVDLPCRLGMRPIEMSELTVFIVLQYEEEDGQEESFGVIVDEVLEVVSMSDEDVSPPPEVGDPSSQDNFLKGVGRVDGNVIFILDLVTALSGGGAS